MLLLTCNYLIFVLSVNSSALLLLLLLLPAAAVDVGSATRKEHQQWNLYNTIATVR